MANRLYIGFDPGVTSGIATIRVDRHGRLSFRSWEVSPLAEVVDQTRELASEDNVSMAVEKFTISARTLKTRIYYESLYFCGWLSLEYPGLVVEQATSCKGARTRSKLGALGWGNPTKDDHADDAGCHVLTLALRHKDPAVLAALGRSVKR